MHPRSHTPVSVSCLALLAALLPLAAAPAADGQLLTPVAATRPPGPHRVSAAASVDCADGLVYDDNALNEAIRFRDGSGNGLQVDAVMRFDVGAPGTKLEQICVCWNRDGIDTPNFSHEIVFFDDNGAGGQPGTEIAAIPFIVGNVPDFPSTTFLSYDLTPYNVTTSSSSVYAGVRWTSGDQGAGSFVLCTDQDGPGQQPMYASATGSGTWTSTDDIFSSSTVPPPTALMVRLEPEAPPPVCPQEPCVDDDFTLCLNDDRYKVTGSFRTPQGQTGEAHVEELTPDTGYFWFFKDTNVEMVVKVLNGCTNNGHYWVFAGGLTNVEVQMEVCDTQEGVLSTYTNPLRTPFQPIQDTSAFATCP